MYQEIFQRMRAIVEQPDYPLLQSYKQDFYTHDLAFLQETWVPGMRYLWIVRKYGTELSIVGFDKRASETAHAYLSSGEPREIYLIDAKGLLTKIDAGTAKEFANVIVYSVKGGLVNRGETKLASLNCQTSWSKGNQRVASVTIITDKTKAPTAIDQVAFQRLALSEAIEQVGSLFISVTSLVIDGVEILTNGKERETGIVTIPDITQRMKAKSVPRQPTLEAA